MRGKSPDTGDRQSRRQVLRYGLKDEDPEYARETQVDEHEELTQPTKDPIPFEIIVQCQQSPDMSRCGKQGEHPDDEEVVRDHGLHFGKADALNANAGYNLLITEREEEFANYSASVWFRASRRIMIELMRRDRPAVMMKESKTWNEFSLCIPWWFV